MIKSLKNWLLFNSVTCLTKKDKFLLVFFCLLIFSNLKSQINFVGNPSFESINCISPNFLKRCYYWNGIDSLQLTCGGLTYNVCYGTVPYAGPGLYQNPRTGNGYARVTFFSLTGSGRIYPKNRLLTNLTAGKTYCAKMYVNLQNCSPYSLDALQIYFGDATLDTITKCNVPLSYLTPQIQNPSGNFVTDTLGWVEVSGTFTATGAEKYLVIGNFKTDAATSTSVTGSCTGNWSEYNVDDVSVIDFNLAAYAGPDKNIFLGDSTFIGRPPEIGLDCTWSTGTVTIGDSAGIWVKPTAPGTYSYVVTQNICGNIKTDTVNVIVSPSSINESMMFANSIGVYPQPAKDLVNISLSYFYESTVSIKITDVNGRVVSSSELAVRNGKTQIETSKFANGVYNLQLISKNQMAQKRLIIAH
jgi:hypothetical protein